MVSSCINLDFISTFLNSFVMARLRIFTWQLPYIWVVLFEVLLNLLGYQQECIKEFVVLNVIVEVLLRYL